MNTLNPYESPKSGSDLGKFEIDWRGIGQALMILVVGTPIGVLATGFAAFLMHS